MNEKIDWVLLVVFYELILGGLGRLFNLPIRMGIFGVACIYTFCIVYRRKKIYTSKFVVTVLLIIIILLGGFAITSLLRGNDAKRILSDINIYISLLYVFIFIELIGGSAKKLDNIIEKFITLTTIISGVTTVLFIWSFIATKIGIDTLAIMINIRDTTNYGIITGWLYDNTALRVYLCNGIFMQVALAILGFRFLNNEVKKSDKLKLMIIILGIITSNTRGYWLGALIVIALLIIYSIRVGKLKLKPIISIISILLVVAFIGYKMELLDSVIDRFKSINDFSGDVSNSIRSVQKEYLVQEIKKYPIIGSGLGVILESYVEAMQFRRIDLELHYYDIVFKGGFIYLFFYLFFIVLFIVKNFNIKNIESYRKEYVYGWGVGVLSVLITSYTNPYLQGAFGFFTLNMLVIIQSVYGYRNTSL